MFAILNNQLQHFQRFVSEIDFAGQAWDKVDVVVEGCDAWALRGEKVAIGWIVNPQEPVAGRSMTVSGLADGTYDVQAFKVECFSGDLSWLERRSEDTP